MLSETEGYSSARSILGNMFGQAHVVAKSLLDEIVYGKPIRNCSDDLLELSHRNAKLLHYHESDVLHKWLEFTYYPRESSSQITHELQQRRVEKASELYEKGIEPSFKDLIEYVQREHVLRVAVTVLCL